MICKFVKKAKFLFSLTTIVVLISQNISFAAPSPQTISYTKDVGTFLYSNNPELVNLSDTADSKKILYSQQGVSGECIAYMGHRNNIQATSLYFGIQIYNNNPTTITITKKNRGYQPDPLNTGGSSNWYGYECWADYFNYDIKKQGTKFFYSDTSSNYENSNYIANNYNMETVIIKPYASAWILGGPNSGVVPYSRLVNGAIRFNVSGGKVTVNFYAVKDWNKFDGTAVPLNYIQENRLCPEGWSNQSLLYKGISNSLPILNSSFNWTIDNSTSVGTILPVKYSSYASSNKLKTNLNSNSAGTPIAYGADLLQLTMPGWAKTISNDTKDATGQYCNLGNWAVQYKYTYNIINNSGKTRTIGVYLQNGSRILVDNGSQNLIVNNSSWDSYGIKVKSISIPTGASQFKISYLLPGMASGSVIHSVKVEN